MGTALAIVLSVSFSQGFHTWKKNAQVKEAEQFETLIQQTQKDPQNAMASLEAFAEKARFGYADITRVQMGDLYFSLGQREKALQAWKEASEDADQKLFRDLALMKYAYQKADDLSFEELKKCLTPALKSHSSFVFAAKELLAFSALKHQKMDQAKKLFQDLSEDDQAPAGIRATATEIISSLE